MCLQVWGVRAEEQRVAPILLRAVYTDSTPVQVFLTSPLGCPRHGTVAAVGTDPPEETVSYSESTPHSDIPSVYAAGLPHALSAFGLTWIFRYRHHHSVRPPVLDQILLVPSVP